MFAWAGAALFFVSLTYFVFTYVVSFAQPAAITPPGAIAWNVALFSAFALHHTIFAREPVRAWVARLVPARLERSLYVWIASLLFIAVCALWRPVSGVLWRVDGAARVLLWLTQLAGVWLTLRSAAIIDVWALAGVRQPGATPTAFRVEGPYAWVRHPIYTGWLLIVFAASPMTGTRFVFAVVSSLYLLVAIPFEERSLQAGSSGAYARYMQQVRWKLVPGLY